jgi:two-component system OmpR family response regulator
MRILLIEDDRNTAEYIVRGMSEQGHVCDRLDNGPDGLSQATREAYDVIVVDRMLPGLDGLSLVKALRATGSKVPVLFLTAVGGVDDRVEGLEAGADDYLTKPFAVRELLARINALGRRAAALPSEPEVLEIDGCTLDLGRLEAVRGEATFKITPREAGILRWLHRHRARAVSRGELLERIWGSSGDLQTRTVDMTIANLRQKIERDPSEPRILLTVTGAGYAWGGDEEP